MTDDVGNAKVNLKSGADAYTFCFGNYADGTKYHDSINEHSIIPELKSAWNRGIALEQKALDSTTGGAGTAGYALVPIFVDNVITDLTRKYTPWIDITPRVMNQGLTADFNQITAKGGGFNASEDDPMAERDNTYVRKSKSIKFFYATGRVTGVMQAAMPSYILQGLQPQGTGFPNATFGNPVGATAKQTEVLVQAQALRELEENRLWNGNSGTSSVQPDGIVVQQGTTNQLDKSTTDLEYDDIELISQYAFDDSGRPNVAGADSSTTKDIRKLMRDQFRYRPGDLNGTFGFGVPAAAMLEVMTGTIPLVPSQFLSGVSGSKQLFFMDMNVLEMRVLQDMTYEELAKTNDSTKFMLKIYECPILRAPQFNAFIDNIK